MNSTSRLSRTQNNLCAEHAVVVGFAVLVALLAADCRHAPLPEKRSSTSGERSQQANVQSAPAAPARPAFTWPHFAVQVAAYEQRSGAEVLASRLSAETGFQTLVAPVEVQGKTYYRVRIMVETKDQADDLANTFLRTSKLKVWVVPL
jgi:hypothetical protein